MLILSLGAKMAFATSGQLSVLLLDELLASEGSPWQVLVSLVVCVFARFGLGGWGELWAPV